MFCPAMGVWLSIVLFGSSGSILSLKKRKFRFCSEAITRAFGKVMPTNDGVDKDWGL